MPTPPKDKSDSTYHINLNKYVINELNYYIGYNINNMNKDTKNNSFDIYEIVLNKYKTNTEFINLTEKVRNLNNDNINELTYDEQKNIKNYIDIYYYYYKLYKDIHGNSNAIVKINPLITEETLNNINELIEAKAKAKAEAKAEAEAEAEALDKNDHLRVVFESGRDNN